MTDKTVQPIPTKFDGILFRSRTEARWAVVFKTLGLSYQYEPEGYDLEGRWYLPDFYIPEWKAYCEVKPYGEPSEEAKWLINALTLKTGVKSCILAGQPGKGRYQVWATADWAWVDEQQKDSLTRAVFGHCRRCPGIWLLAPEGDTSYWASSVSCGPDCDSYKYSDDQSGELGKAMHAGAACRFDDKQ